VTQPEIRLSARAIARLLGRHEPTDEQVRIIESPLEPALVVAGAGSGKTETMAARVVWLIANKLVQPQQVLGLTFTRKAAGELMQRVQTRLAQLNRALGEESGEALAGLDLDRPTVATYNAYAASLVADHGLRLGVEPSARLLGQAEQWQLASQVVESWDEDLGTDKAVSTVTGAVVALSGALGEHLVDPADARDRLVEMAEHLESIPLGPRQKKRTKDVDKLISSVAERARFVDLVVEYRRRKRIAETLDFGDQVAFAAQLAREVPLVGAAERARFEVVLLDEYQDTYEDLLVVRKSDGALVLYKGTSSGKYLSGVVVSTGWGKFVEVLDARERGNGHLRLRADPSQRGDHRAAHDAAGIVERTHQGWHGVRRLRAEPGERPCLMRPLEGATLLQGIGEPRDGDA
jgi:DNA helicase-2/ATP-dependent DNA helicase PcrA